MLKKIGIGFICVALLFFVMFFGWKSDAAVFFGLLFPALFVFIGVILLLIVPKDMSVTKKPSAPESPWPSPPKPIPSKPTPPINYLPKKPRKK